jgi:hypothetical protein
MQKVIIIGGGTVFHIRPHLALSAPAYGQTAVDIADLCDAWGFDWDVQLHLTRMAYAQSKLETNDDISKLLDEVLADRDTKIVFMSAALCDFNVSLLADSSEIIAAGENPGHPKLLPVGKDQPRLRSDLGRELALTPADKVIHKIRKQRKDVFLVGFKTTTNASVDDQFAAGLKLMKQNSCNLVLANDLHTKLNMVITPEQAKYHVTTDRGEAIRGLVAVTKARSGLTFTRSTVLPGDPVKWNSDEVPAALRTVVDHCIKRGAYRPFLGATVGHFAVKVDHSTFLTSMRKTNFNEIDKIGLVKVQTVGKDAVVAYGAKPSVGGQSQRIIFAEHPDVDCIVHFHCQKKESSAVPVRSQREFECGSMQCGENTSAGLMSFGKIKAVMLSKHGPNIVFHHSVSPSDVISFIEDNFDLDHQTSELS